jgi:sensor domain CHASE-containing protein
METNWLLVILVIVTALVLIVLFIKRNQKDKKDFVRELIKDDEESIQKEPDTEVNSTD